VISRETATGNMTTIYDASGRSVGGVTTSRFKKGRRQPLETGAAWGLVYLRGRSGTSPSKIKN
jgi:hypothetical protein